jgi:hypothetical protein
MNSKVRSSAERLASLLHETLNSVCIRRRVSITRLSADVASALEAFPWSGKRQEMEEFWESVVGQETRLCLTIDQLPRTFRRRVTRIQSEAEVDPKIS